jgi:hypothetical protein
VVEASHISCRNGTESSLVEVYSPFEPMWRPDQYGDWPVAREQANALEEKVNAEKWVVPKAAALGQSRDFCGNTEDGA